jgi:hypothetical protein
LYGNLISPHISFNMIRADLLRIWGWNFYGRLLRHQVVDFTLRSSNPTSFARPNNAQCKNLIFFIPSLGYSWLLFIHLKMEICKFAGCKLVFAQFERQSWKVSQITLFDGIWIQGLASSLKTLPCVIYVMGKIGLRNSGDRQFTQRDQK